MGECWRIWELEYDNTGETKKEGALRIMGRIKRRIKACSVPNRIGGGYGDEYPGKNRYIDELARSIPGKVAIGCTELGTLAM